MTTITTYAGKGSQLTIAEVDANFTNLNNDKAENTVVAGKAAAGANSDITSLSAVTSINGGPMSGFRNAFINPGMAVDQRNAGAAQTFTAGAALAYCVDRWYGYCTGANVTGQRVAGSGNSQYRYQFTGAASVTGIGFGQRIETINSYRFAGTTATLAIDLANSLLTTVTWTAYYANTTDTFGTLASPTRTSIASGTFTVNSTVTRYFAPITIPSAATTGIEVVLSVGAQTSGTWTIGKAALLPSGANEVHLEPRPYPLELFLCQRYCWPILGSFTGYANGTTVVDCAVSYPPMRAIPSVVSGVSAVASVVTSAGNTSTQSAVSVSFPGVGIQTAQGSSLRFSNFTGLTNGSVANVYTNASTPASFLVSEL
jgi:hypothetical protein